MDMPRSLIPTNIHRITSAPLAAPRSTPAPRQSTAEAHPTAQSDHASTCSSNADRTTDALKVEPTEVTVRID
jgi:hypothetical protein